MTAVEVEEKKIVFGVEQYVESAIVVDIPDGYHEDDIDWGYIEYDTEGNMIAILVTTDGKEHDMGQLPEFMSDDKPRVRITDEEWTGEYYDSWQ